MFLRGQRITKSLYLWATAVKTEECLNGNIQCIVVTAGTTVCRYDHLRCPQLRRLSALSFKHWLFPRRCSFYYTLWCYEWENLINFQINLGRGYDTGVNQILSVSGDGSNITSLSLSTYGAGSFSGGNRSVEWNIVKLLVEQGMFNNNGVTWSSRCFSPPTTSLFDRRKHQSSALLSIGIDRWPVDSRFESLGFNSSPPGAAYMRQCIESTLVQIMPCRLLSDIVAWIGMYTHGIQSATPLMKSVHGRVIT